MVEPILVPEGCRRATYHPANRIPSGTSPTVETLVRRLEAGAALGSFSGRYDESDIYANRIRSAWVRRHLETTE